MILTPKKTFKKEKEKRHVAKSNDNSGFFEQFLHNGIIKLADKAKQLAEGNNKANTESSHNYIFIN